MTAREEKNRRQKQQNPGRRLESELNEAQLMTLRSLETFGLELKFIRRPLFQPPVPVVFDASREKFAILEEDGTLNENPDIEIR